MTSTMQWALGIMVTFLLNALLISYSFGVLTTRVEELRERVSHIDTQIDSLSRK
jgi:hypothetical protein